MSDFLGSSKPGGCITYTSSSISPLRKALFTSIEICKSKHNTNGFETSNRSISFAEINTFDLGVTLCYQTCFVSYHNAIFILLVAKNPLCTNDVVLRWVRSVN